MEPTNILRKVLVNAVNHLLTLIAVWLIQKGIVSKDILTPENIGILAAGAVAGAISIFMVVYRRIKERFILREAKAAAPFTSNAIITDRAKEAIKAETVIPNMLVH